MIWICVPTLRSAHRSSPCPKRQGSAPRPPRGRLPTVRRSIPPPPIRSSDIRVIISAYWIEEPAMITRITPNLTLAWVPAISGPRRPPDTRFWLALGIPSPSSSCAGGQGRATCTLSDCRFLCRAEWWDSGLVVSWVSRSVSDACVAVSALGQRRRWGRSLETAFAGTLLREARSSTEVDGMRPLIRIDRTEMYHWGLLDVLLASWGRRLRLRVLRPCSVWPACWPPERAVGQRLP